MMYPKQYRRRSLGTLGLVGCLVVGQVGALIPTPALAMLAPGDAQVPQRAIDLFSSADEEFNRKNYSQAATLAEGALGHTNPEEHRDQRGSLIQLLIRAYTKAFFKDGHIADLCRLEQILADYSEEVSRTFEDAASRERVLAAIEEHRSSNRAHLLGSPAFDPDVGCPGTKKADEGASELPEPEGTPGLPEPEGTPEPPEPAPETIQPERNPMKKVKDNPRPRGRSAVIIGSTFLGLSGAMLIGAGIGASLFKGPYRENQEIHAKLEAEDRMSTAEEDKQVDDNIAKAVSYRNLAIGMGISAAVLMTVGLPVLAVGLQRRRKARKNMALQPVFSPTHAGLSLRGQF